MMEKKKQMMVVAGLVVLMLGVGAFQFMQSPAPSEKKVSKTSGKEKLVSQVTATYSETDSSTTANSQKALLAYNGDPAGEGNPVTGQPADPEAVLANLAHVAARDPFDGSAWSDDVAVASDTPGAKPANPNTKIASNGPVRNSYVPPRPSSMQGNFGPVHPGTGNISLPTVGPDQGGAPVAQMPSLDDVNYTVTGVVNGRKQAAVFTDAQGGQRLVRVGQKLDADTEVVGVMRGQVIVRHRGKTKVLGVDYTKAAESKAPAKDPNPQPNDVAGKPAPTGTQ